MMVFADTVFYLALSNPHDQWYAIADQVVRGFAATDGHE